jgi:4-aminobutyrate aminotransferase/(S)-3-amino-2-methylpropionate transaminase
LTYPTTDDELNIFVDLLEERIAQGDVAALISEPGIVTGWGSVLLAAPRYLTETHALLQRYGILLIVDEVGTGFSRTGHLFAIEREGAIPDILVLGKAIANGSGTIAVTVIKEHLGEPAATSANLTSTLGWNPLAASAALMTLLVHKRDRVWETAATKSAIVLGKLDEYREKGYVGEVRGRGLEIGVELRDYTTYQKVISDCRDRGLLLIGDYERNLQLMPPLTISLDRLEGALDVLGAVLKTCA